MEFYGGAMEFPWSFEVPWSFMEAQWSFHGVL